MPTLNGTSPGRERQFNHKVSVWLTPAQRAALSEGAIKSGVCLSEFARRVMDDWIEGRSGQVYPCAFVRGRGRRTDIRLTLRQGDALHRKALAHDISTSEQARWVIVNWLEVEGLRRSAPAVAMVGARP